MPNWLYLKLHLDDSRNIGFMMKCHSFISFSSVVAPKLGVLFDTYHPILLFSYAIVYVILSQSHRSHLPINTPYNQRFFHRSPSSGML